MQVSIIVPTFNESSNVRGCLDSAWQAEPLEVIVVDGGSQDDTLAHACDDRTILLHSSRGRAIQQNLGAAAASGDVLLFLHADCRLCASAVNQIRDVLRNEEVLYGSFRQRILANGWRYRILEQSNDFRAGALRLPYGDQGIFIRRAVFERVGGFPEYRLMEDLELVVKLRQESRPVLLPGPIHVGARRWEQNGIVRQTIRNWTLATAWRCGVHPDKLADYY